MKPSKRVLNESTEAIKKDISILSELNLDASKINERSAVFERDFADSQGVEVPVFLKIYTYRRHPFDRLCRSGRSRNEARNLIFFNKIGIPSAEVLAWGERKGAFGKPLEEFIITRAVSGAQTLDTFVAQHCPDRSRPEYCAIRDQILTDLGRYTAKIHKEHFFHKDLKWRNILAKLENDHVKLCWIDCPSGNFYPPPWPQQHGRLKDCATLDKIARYDCSREERLRFIASYLNEPEDSTAVEEFARDISAFRRKRFDPKDDKQRRKNSHASAKV